jgi:pyruvate/2-oxoglutarate dehydrogenase complex dihydrolipoamide acyltransferase (E2) component
LLRFSDLDEQSAPTPTTALEPAVNGNTAAAAANGDGHEAGSNGNAETAADKAAAAEAEAAQEAAEAASFFKLRAGEQPLAYAVRVFERIYGHDIEKVLSMEVGTGWAGRASGFGFRV